MPKRIKQIKVVISCPSDVHRKKQIVEDVCESLSKIFSQRSIHIRPIHWKRDVTPIITGDRPQEIINQYFEREDYDIHLGILWKKFGDVQENGLTPTEEEFEIAFNQYRGTRRPLITVFFKEKEFYPRDEYETRQFLAVQRFKNRTESLGLYDTFRTELEFQGKVFVWIQESVEKLVTARDNQIAFEKIKYSEVKSYIRRKVYPAYKYKPDEFWFLPDEYKDDVTHVIKVKNRIALIGDAGSGKTFELERIANRFSHKNSTFYPLLIRLNTYTDQSIAELLPENWNSIPENQLLIILDGLDEIESKNKKDAIRKIELFSEQHSASTIIISCRTNFYQTESEQVSGTLRGFESYRLLPLDFEEIKSYVEARLSSRTSRFLNVISRNQLGALVHIPFYLVKLVELFESEDAFPNRKAVVLERLFLARIRLDEEHYRSTVDLNEHRDTIINSLERVSLGMECLGRNYISDDEFRKLIPDISLRNLIEHCTAWKKEDAEKLTWQFEHNSIQEYLAARVLSRQPPEIVKDFISFKPDHKKIIPSWVNTVSFLLSISEDSNLINWILQIEPEICLKFEPDKISKHTRIKIFKEIFDRYKEKRIWIDRERFRDDELARFGQLYEVIDYLINEAENAEHPTTLGNAIGILSEMLMPPAFKDRTRDLLENVALNKFQIEISASIQSKALIALSHLKFDSKDVLERIVSALRNSKNDWVRYGLYYLIHNSEFLDEFLDVFFEGIPYLRMDVSNGRVSRLANERWELKQGLKKLKSPNSIIKLFGYFAENKRDLQDVFIGNHDISFLAEITSKAFLQDSSLLDRAIDFSLSMLNNYQKKEAGQFLLFYERTNTRLDAFKNVLGKESQYKEEFLSDLADEQCLDLLDDEYAKGRVSDDEMWKFLYALRWKNNKLFDHFYNKINQKYENKFKLKPVPDWDKLEKERRQQDIDLIFDINGLIKDIHLIFETEQKEVFTPEELSKLRSKYWSNKYYSNLAYQTLRKIAGNKNVKMRIVQETMKKWDLDLFRISNIYEKIRADEELELSKQQESWIADWCDSNFAKVDFKIAIQKTGKTSFSVRTDAIYVWYFFRKFNLKYPKNILLDMLSFDHERNGIEYLEGYLDETEMTSCILENLSEGIIIDDVLKNHIEYCKKHGIKEVIKYALKEIANQDRDPYDEIRRISLEAVCKLSEDISELEEILPEVKDEFKWQVIDELMKGEGKKVRPFLEELFEKSDGDERIKTAEYLIRCQNLKALRFYVGWIKEQKGIQTQSFEYSPLRFLRIPEAIPGLIELLALSYKGEIQQPKDIFERLDRLVLDSLTAIALESEQNYLAVSNSIDDFIEKYSATYDEVNWLNAFLDQLEQKYYINKSEKYEIKDVLRKLEGMAF